MHEVFSAQQKVPQRREIQQPKRFVYFTRFFSSAFRPVKS